MKNKIVSLSSSVDFTSARLNDIVLQIWHKETTLAGVGSLRAAIAKVASESAAGLRLLIVVESGAAMPTRNARTSIADFMTEFKSSILENPPAAPSARSLRLPLESVFAGGR